VDESSPTEPVAETAQVLLEAEKILLEEAKRTKLGAVILRVAGIYGPGRGYWLRQFLRGDARIEGDGARILNMIHRVDVGSAILTALRRGSPGQIYNVVDDEPVSQLAFFEWLSKRLCRELPVATPEHLALPRKRGVTNKRVSNRRLRMELECELTYPTFREGFEEQLDGL